MIVSLVDVFYSFSRFVSAFFGQWFGQEFWLTRFVFLRALGFIYFIAFLGVFNQFKGLFGQHGLLPAHLFLDRVAASYGQGVKSFWSLPTLFWIC